MSEIKALEWQDAKDKGYAQANCVLGQYQVSWLGEFECWQCCRPHKAGNSWADNFSRHPSKDEAKAAAQADYEARIRSALVERKAEPVAWQWCAYEDGSQRTSWYPEGDSYQAGWEELAKKYPDKYQVVTRPLYSTPPAAPATYQDRVAAAHHALFHDDPTDVPERVARFMEEANETCQAFGMTCEEAHQLVDYTYSRPAGEPAKEIGAAMLTLTSLCVVAGYDLMPCAEADLEKLKRPETIARIRSKRSTRHGRGPLPGYDALSASPSPVDSRDGLITDAMVKAYKEAYLKHCDDALNGRIPRAEDFTFEASRKGIAAALAAKEQQP